MEVVGYGRVESGKLKLVSPDLWRTLLERWKDGEVVITVETPSQSRTARQLRYYFGVVVAEICRHEARKRGSACPYPKDAMHELLKRHFMPAERDQLDLGEISTATTKDLDTKRMTEYIEEIREHYRHDDPPLFIPEPHEPPEGA